MWNEYPLLHSVSIYNETLKLISHIFLHIPPTEGRPDVLIYLLISFSSRLLHMRQVKIDEPLSRW